MNHVGFTPAVAKHCLVMGTGTKIFEVLDTANEITVYRGAMEPAPGDLGSYTQGRFDDLVASGEYRIRIDSRESGSFRIGSDVYQDALQKGLGYFAHQRCGDSGTGYNTPCHLDSGVRDDNGQHQDVTGGWHDATDVRKWVNATLYGMIGLLGVADCAQDDVELERIIDELRWGNTYFLKMQEPDGYVLHGVADQTRHRWTDNRPGTEDDLPVLTTPAPLTAQYLFVASQAGMMRLTGNKDPDYAARCRRAAEACLDWCEGRPRTAIELGSAVWAYAEMYRTTGQNRFEVRAVGYAQQLLSLQVKRSPDTRATISGYFLRETGSEEPSRDPIHGQIPLIGLCRLVQHLSGHAEEPVWRSAIEAYCTFCLATMADRSAFGIVPFGLFREDHGGDRRVGDVWYRWFMNLDARRVASGVPWWVGMNANLASAGVGLVQASNLLSDPELMRLAQRQLDWIVGVNPFNASTIMDVGRNQAPIYANSALSEAPVPLIPGAVMNGIGGTRDDRPSLNRGPGDAPDKWQTCEYWTPMVGYTLWLMATLGA